MPKAIRAKDLMVPLEDYPHIPYWFTLRQAMAIVREASIKFEGSFEPRSVLVFDEKYQLLGILTQRDIIKGLEPKLLSESDLSKVAPDLEVLLADLFKSTIQERSQRPVSEVMRPIAATMNADDSIAKGLSLMLQKNVNRVPVIQEGRVAGMLRMSDLFVEIYRIMQEE